MATVTPGVPRVVRAPVRDVSAILRLMLYALLVLTSWGGMWGFLLLAPVRGEAAQPLWLLIPAAALITIGLLMYSVALLSHIKATHARHRATEELWHLYQLESELRRDAARLGRTAELVSDDDVPVSTLDVYDRIESRIDHYIPAGS